MTISASRIVPICSICVLALAALINSARGRKKQTFDGIFVRTGPSEEFYPGAKNCSVSGIPYLVLSNPELEERTSITTDDLFHNMRGVWRVRFTGDLSPIGMYERAWRRYWRTVRVSSVLRAERLDSCKDLE